MELLVRSIPDMPWRTPHGSRYATAAILRDAGCDVDQICSIIGHRTYEMAMKYLKRRRLAIEAMAMMVRSAALPVPPVPVPVPVPAASAALAPFAMAVQSCRAGSVHPICRMTPPTPVAALLVGSRIG